MRKTRSGLPKHCYYNPSPSGKQRIRFRKRGYIVYLTGIPWSAAFMRQYAAALERVASPADIGAARTIPGSFDALCVAYYSSAEFGALSASTQVHRRGIIEAFRKQHGTKPLRELSRTHIKSIISAKKATPEAANALLKTLKVMLGYAVDISLIETNPTVGIKKYKSRAGGGFHTWTEAEVERFRERHPSGTTARLALELLLGTAQRRGDVVKLGWQHERQGELALRQSKTNRALVVPMHDDLVVELRQLPRTGLTFLVMSNGAPFSPKSFSDWFRKRCNEASLPHCSAHGLRKAAARRLAEAGCSANEIAAITGHATLGEVARYTKEADQLRLARAGRARERKEDTGLPQTVPRLPQEGEKS
jgi:integrase